MSFSSEVKHKAKMNLSQNNWMKSIIIFSIVFVILYVANTFVEQILLSFLDISDNKRLIDFLFSLSSSTENIKVILILTAIRLTFLFIFSPLLIGCLKFYIDIANGSSASISVIFHFLKTPKIFLKTLFFIFEIVFKITFNILFCLLPGVLSLVFCSYIIKNNGDVGFSFFHLAILFSIILIFSGILFSVIKNSQYFIAPFLFASKPKYKNKIYFKQSSIKMKRYKGFVLVIFLNFFLHLLFCFFVIPMIYVFPLFLEMFAVSSKRIVEDDQ
ncbi:MAG: hypothetical protein LBI55_02905 [Oscillospiraceae bacterium]|jgi:hypothetical protein|nr:hypothetical protein [Oscillospiraceae bacterium]